MIIINSAKLLFSNFYLTYKSFLYKLAVFFITLAGVFTFSTKAFEILHAGGVFASFKNIFTGGITNVGDNVYIVFEKFINIATTNFSKVAVPLIIACIVLYLVGNTLISMDSVAVDANLETKMSANYKSSYIGAFLKNFWASLGFAFIKTLSFILFDFVLIYALIQIIPLVNVSTLKILWIFLLILGGVIYISLKNTIYCFFAPHIAVSEDGVRKSFILNFKLLFKNFFIILGNRLILTIIFIVLNIVFGLLTFGVGFIIIIPMTIIWTQTFNMTAYYEVTGNRYYLENNVIRSPKKLNEKQKIEDIIDLV